MRRKRSHASPFLIGSLVIHLLVVLILMRVSFYDPDYRPFPYEPRIETDISRYTRPEVRPRERIAPPEPADIPEPAPEQPKIDKPQPAATAEWSATESSPTTERNAVAGRMDSSTTKERRISAIEVKSEPTARLLTSNVAISQPTITSETSGKTILPDGGQDIKLGEDSGALRADSPGVALENIRFGHRRGQALGGMPVGNAGGGGGGTSGTSPGDNYIQMMTELAYGVTETATTDKIDVVFVIDKTGSMEDNVRGIRAYVDVFFEHFSRSGHDSAFGVVTFADTRNDKPDVRGVTTKTRKFKEWLFQIDFQGGGDLAESGLDALMAAVELVDYRKGAQRFFVLASDGAFHDADYDGRSAYSQDEVIETLQRYGIRADVIGLDYLPVKQIAWATGGTWQPIPGRGYLEYIPPTLTEKMLSEFGTLGYSDSLSQADELVVYVNRNPRPSWLDVTWKVLNPLGVRAYGPVTERIAIPNTGENVVRFMPPIDMRQFLTTPGAYTIIYKLENNLGHRSILRRVLEASAR